MTKGIYVLAKCKTSLPQQTRSAAIDKFSTSKLLTTSLCRWDGIASTSVSYLCQSLCDCKLISRLVLRLHGYIMHVWGRRFRSSFLASGMYNPPKIKYKRGTTIKSACGCSPSLDSRNGPSSYLPATVGMLLINGIVNRIQVNPLALGKASILEQSTRSFLAGR